MNDHIQPVNMTALEAAVTALVGAERAQILRELYIVIDAAEKRGEARSNAVAWNEGLEAGYDKGFEDGYNKNFKSFQVDEEDLREPMVNAAVEGDVFTDMSKYHVKQPTLNAIDQSWVDAALEGAPADFTAPNRSPVSDEEFYDAINEHYNEDHATRVMGG